MPSKRTTSFRSRLLKNETLAEKRAYEILSSMDVFIEKQKRMKARLDDGTQKAYFLDFYLTDYRLGVEIDGGIHHSQTTHDTKRDLALMRFGSSLLIIRFTNEDVLYRPQYFRSAVSEALVNRVAYLNNFEDGRELLDMADRRIELKTWRGQFIRLMKKFEDKTDRWTREDILIGYKQDGIPDTSYTYDDETETWKGFPIYEV